MSMNTIKNYVARLYSEGRLLSDEQITLDALLTVLEAANIPEADALKIFQDAVQETYGVDPFAPEPFSRIYYSGHNIEEFVSDAWTDANWYDVPRRLSYADAQYNLRAMIEEGIDVPYYITAADFMHYWNARCDEQFKQAAGE